MCTRQSTTPTALSQLDGKEAANFIFDMIAKLEKENKSGCYIQNCVKSVKSWLAFSGVEIKQNIKLPDKLLVTVGEEVPPTIDELRRILNACDLRARVAVSLMAFCGFRIEVLGSYDGTDGLEVKDIPELQLDAAKKSVTYSSLPAKVVVRRTLSKTSKSYFTFLCEEGAEYLRVYLENRFQSGEKLDKNSPIITPYHSPYIGKHIRSNNISDLIRKGIRTAGFKWRPYVLRRYFDSRMMLAESDGLIIPAYRTFWMGHSGDIEATYTVNKGLSEDIVQRMRESYSEAIESHLSTQGKRKTMSPEEIIATVNKTTLTSFGIPESDIESLGDLSKLTPEEIHKFVQNKTLGLNGNRQKVVPLSEVKSYIEQGWEYVKELPTNEIIVSLPKA